MHEPVKLWKKRKTIRVIIINFHNPSHGGLACDNVSRDQSLLAEQAENMAIDLIDESPKCTKVFLVFPFL